MRSFPRRRLPILAAEATGLLAAACGDRSGSGDDGAAVTADTALSVGHFVRNHETDRDPRTVEGFVDAGAAEEGTIGLTDGAESEPCTDEECKRTLPVRRTRPVPTVGQRVRRVASSRPSRVP